MLSQPAPDAVRSAHYVENYLDCMENLPEDIQKYITRLHELDVTYRNYMKDAENFKETLQKEDLDTLVQRKTLFKLEQVLISLQEVGDEKVEIGQHILDLIDNKYRALDLELRELGAAAEVLKEEEVVEAPSTRGGSSASKERERERETRETERREEGTESSGGGNGGERAKRPRRGGREESQAPVASASQPSDPPPEVQKGTKRHSTSGKKGPKGGKKKSRSNDSPPREEDIISTQVGAEIDEPTYCLCDQISYGEMILCDNDLCPIEWFHFVCVSLTTKPKGKWFCPKCRGDRPNVMKPKSQFLKELERYNKEKEEKS